MKRIIAMLISLSMIFALAGCGNHNNQISNEKESDNGSKLYIKAMEILDEFKEREEVQDFLVAYNLLMTLPDDEDGFIKQLDKVNDIYSKYGVELHTGDYYLGKPGTFAISAESIKKYKSKSAYHDAKDLLNSIVYPILFEKYGAEAQAIEGITAEEIIYAINSTNDYVLDEESESYDGFTKKWKYAGVPTTGYEIEYHSNGLVESINVPIIRSSTPLTDDDYEAILNKPMDEQKIIAGNRFAALTNEFNTFFTGYEVLSRIFTDKELEIISNYIHSITTEELWKRNLAFNGGSEPTTYIYAVVCFDYKGNDISIHYGLNGIYLRIIGNNYINQLSNKWHTVWLGLCEKGYGEEAVDLWSLYIKNDVSFNDTVQEWSYDLDSNADQFTDATSPNISSSDENTFSENPINPNTELDNSGITPESKANIEIIAVSPCKEGMGDITVDYQINNIQDMRGCVYLHSDSLSFFHQMFFRDENHIDEYREDGKYSFNVSWLNDGVTKYFSIGYGYGTFNGEDGWTNFCSTKIYYRLTQDYGRISSNTIPQNEIHAIYDGEKYIGAWTLNQSGDLIETDGDSEKEPFTKNTVFYSESGNTVSVSYENGNYVFYINGNMIGVDSEGIQTQDALIYEIDVDTGTYLITRYPNDEYISVSVVGRLNTSIEGIYNP